LSFPFCLFSLLQSRVCAQRPDLRFGHINALKGLFSDVMMPAMDGMTFCQRIREDIEVSNPL